MSRLMSAVSSFVVASLFSMSPGCDGAAIDSSAGADPSAEVAQGALEPALTGRVVLEGDDYAPVAQAQVLFELLDVDGETVQSLETTSDADGIFALDRVPEGVTSVEAHVFIGGEHAGTETIPVIKGDQPKTFVVVALTASVLCIATTWASARKVSGSDKMKHCVASCRTTRWCGLGSAFTAAVLKEIFDSLCATGPQWLKDLLSPVSACGGWDNADMAANGRGIWCAGRWRTCESCCDDSY